MKNGYSRGCCREVVMQVIHACEGRKGVEKVVMFAWLPCTREDELEVLM